jgi:hypothetical protein
MVSASPESFALADKLPEIPEEEVKRLAPVKKTAESDENQHELATQI